MYPPTPSAPTSIHRHQQKGETDRSEAQTVCCLKAAATAVLQKGQWRGAWEYTYLPDIGESEAGVNLEEKASVSRYLREKATVEKILEEARTDEKKR